MKMSVVPSAVSRSQYYLALALVLAIAFLQNSYGNSSVVVALCIFLIAGSLTLMISVHMRRPPSLGFIAFLILPLFLLFPLGTAIAFAILRVLTRKESKDYFAGKWRPTRDALMALRKERANRSSEQLGCLLLLLGGVAGFVGTAYACQMHSKEAMQVGWLFCFITVPAAGCMAMIIGKLLVARWRPVGESCPRCGFRNILHAKNCKQCKALLTARVPLNPTR